MNPTLELLIVSFTIGGAAWLSAYLLGKQFDKKYPPKK
jgi:hypothetical protein